MEGTLIKDIWYDIEHLHGSSHEYLGYQTQKPETLLERIIRAASNEGDIVLDPFCGCGTAVAVAERLKRRWIGIDVTYLAIDLIRKRLQGFLQKRARPLRRNRHSPGPAQRRAVIQAQPLSIRVLGPGLGGGPQRPGKAGGGPGHRRDHEPAGRIQRRI